MPYLPCRNQICHTKRYHTTTLFSRNDYGRKFIDLFGKQNMSQKHTPQLWVPAVKVLSIGNDLFLNINIASIYFYFKLV